MFDIVISGGHIIEGSGNPSYRSDIGINGDRITVNQGESLNRPSIINCEMIREDNETKIKVGGNAVLVLEGVINI